MRMIQRTEAAINSSIDLDVSTVVDASQLLLASIALDGFARRCAFRFL